MAVGGFICRRWVLSSLESFEILTDSIEFEFVPSLLLSKKPSVIIGVTSARSTDSRHKR